MQGNMCRPKLHPSLVRMHKCKGAGLLMGISVPCNIHKNSWVVQNCIKSISSVRQNNCYDIATNKLRMPKASKTNWSQNQVNTCLFYQVCKMHDTWDQSNNAEKSWHLRLRHLIQKLFLEATLKRLLHPWLTMWRSSSLTAVTFVFGAHTSMGKFDRWNLSLRLDFSVYSKRIGEIPLVHFNLNSF